MYALPNKTQHKLIVKVRGGISQKLDNFASSSASAAATSFSSASNNLSSPIGLASSSAPFISSTSLRRDSASSRFNGTFEDNDMSNLPQPVFHSINHHGGKQKSSSYYQRAQKQYITPEHNEMIKYVQQSWKGVERDYKKSVNNVIKSLDLNGSSSDSLMPMKQRQVQANKKTPTTSTPLLLSGSYHHTSAAKDTGSGARQDSFQPFDLEAFWGNRILKRLTGDI